MTKEPIQLKLRPFTQTDFGHLISWVSTPETLGQWPRLSGLHDQFLGRDCPSSR